MNSYHDKTINETQEQKEQAELANDVAPLQTTSSFNSQYHTTQKMLLRATSTPSNYKSSIEQIRKLGNHQMTRQSDRCLLEPVALRSSSRISNKDSAEKHHSSTISYCKNDDESKVMALMGNQQQRRQQQTIDKNSSNVVQQQELGESSKMKKVPDSIAGDVSNKFLKSRSINKALASFRAKSMLETMNAQQQQQKQIVGTTQSFNERSRSKQRATVVPLRAPTTSELLNATHSVKSVYFPKNAQQQMHSAEGVGLLSKPVIIMSGPAITNQTKAPANTANTSLYMKKRKSQTSTRKLNDSSSCDVRVKTSYFHSLEQGRKSVLVPAASNVGSSAATITAANNTSNHSMNRQQQLHRQIVAQRSPGKKAPKNPSQVLHAKNRIFQNLALFHSQVGDQQKLVPGSAATSDLTYSSQLHTDAAVAKASDANLKQFIKSATPLLQRQYQLKTGETGKASGSSVTAIKSLKQAHNQLFK